MKVFSVSELTFSIKALLEQDFGSIAVQGEVSNCKMQSSGHFYFSLKDAGAQLSSVLFKGTAQKLSQLPKEGDQVIASGSLSLYAPRGQYQLIVKELRFVGIGELLLQLQMRKEALEKRGWFDPKHKKPLPKIPQKIGVITSPTGAVIQDILHVLSRRFPNFSLILNPVKVQGEGAAYEIAQAIEDMNRYALADVLIVGRGGGSIEDLWAFNEEIVAKAIFDSKIPIVSAIGHETDFTIADFVADVRAPTPSAAAEIIIGEKALLVQSLKKMHSDLRGVIEKKIEGYRNHINALKKHPLLSSPYGILAPALQRIDDFSKQLEWKITGKLESCYKQMESVQKHPILCSAKELLSPFRQKLLEKQNLLERKSPLEKIAQYKEKLSLIEEHLRSIHPQNLLKQGYALLFSEKDDSLILSIKNLSPGGTFKALLQDGAVHAEVQTVES